MVGQVAHLAQMMQGEAWEEFWKRLNLALYRFADVGLATDASDVEIWKLCQAEQLILITDNRNDNSPDSLEAAIRDFNTPTSLPVLTIANLEKFGASRDYQERVLVTFYDYLLRIDELRGTGRLFLPGR